jgi:hypothetical protein
MGLMIATLFMAGFTAGAFVADEPAMAIQPGEALLRAAQLRTEAIAHQDMASEVAAQTGGSRRDRKWRKTMVALCREYAAAANRGAEEYERAAGLDSAPSSAQLRPHAMLPVTAAEYDARAADYEAQAAWLRADADTHLSMLRSSRERDRQPYYGPGPRGQRPGGVWFQSPRERAQRESCEAAVQQSLELAREADNMAKHFRLRARQLEATPGPLSE